MSSASTSSASSTVSLSSNNNDKSNDEGWGEPHFQPKEIPGLNGFYAYTRADYTYWLHVYKHVDAIHRYRIHSEHRTTPREADQMTLLSVCQDDSHEELVRRAVAEMMNFLWRHYDPQVPISYWPVSNDRYNKQ